MKEPWEGAKASDSTHTGCWWLRCGMEAVHLREDSFSLGVRWPSQTYAQAFLHVNTSSPKSSVGGLTGHSDLPKMKEVNHILSISKYIYLGSLQYTWDLFLMKKGANRNKDDTTTYYFPYIKLGYQIIWFDTGPEVLVVWMGIGTMSLVILLLCHNLGFWFWLR